MSVASPSRAHRIAARARAFPDLALSPALARSFAGYINDILLGLGATEADREAYFWSTGALAYRVAAP